ncbi:hypothetical protein P692DRAFT_20891771, partial [Suillus brevipes Sb2]
TFPPAYPHFDLYPRVQIHASRDGKDLTISKFFASSSMYPFLVIYPAVYPHFDLYPARAAEPLRLETETFNKSLVSAYPFLVVYPHVYPHFNLYPARAAELASREEVTTTNNKLFVSSITYPFLVIYPVVYPHFDLYPARAAEVVTRSEPSWEHVTISCPPGRRKTVPLCVLPFFGKAPSLMFFSYFTAAWCNLKLLPSKVAQILTRESLAFGAYETKAAMEWTIHKIHKSEVLAESWPFMLYRIVFSCSLHSTGCTIRPPILVSEHIGSFFVFVFIEPSASCLVVGSTPHRCLPYNKLGMTSIKRLTAN